MCPRPSNAKFPKIALLLMVYGHVNAFTHACPGILVESVAWFYDTFSNTLEIKNDLTMFLKEIW